jgi:uncharacterized membrane protein YedE/YeeE
MTITIIIFVFGVIFGFLIRYSNLNRFDVISRDSTLKDLSVAKTILLVIGVGAILLNSEIAMGLASYHVKPFVVGGIILGGILFGIGMAILGYCPGTLPISMGEGSVDALVGIIGGLFGGLFYTIVLPFIKPIIGANLGSISLNSLIGDNSTLFFVSVLIISILFIVLAFVLHKFEMKSNERKNLNYKWVVTGVGLAVLNSIVFLKSTTNRPIGASTSYPYVIDAITGITKNSYFEKISIPGNWELIFLAGAFFISLAIALFKKEFKLKVIHSHWQETRGTSEKNRLVWAFVGGFILLFGARMAGGCTSGHIISGGMQMAISSLVFGVFVFAAFIVTGKQFYKK